jgi:leucyl-tRNA synthetase
MAEYYFKEIEKKWQANWESEKVFEVTEDDNKDKCYVLEMFPYPSGSGLHVGHAFNFTIGDIYARYQRAKGKNVLYPMGYDSLGLPAENAAIKAGEHPKKYTNKAIANFVKQQKAMGFSYDWNRKLQTHDSSFYKWDQWIFLKMLEKGLAYKKKSSVNWCPKCETVLANEQVHGGKCWRHEDTDVEIKNIEQWFLKTTEYADELLDKVDDLNWPDRIKAMQKNWIGRSEGVEIKFEINGQQWEIFTTRPDTIYGVTFMVVSAQHPELMKLVTEKQKSKVEEFLKKIKSVSEKEMEDLEKEGVFTGSYAVNPVTNEKVPVYAGNFVVADYGSGMVMAVPAHDQRDFEFAKKYGIEIKVVIDPVDYSLNSEKMARAFTGRGRLVNSEKFNGWDNIEAIDEIAKFLEEKGVGKKTIQFKLRDWLISRQRYWGTPIPVVYCGNCGVVPVPENELPVELPEKVEFGKGNPLTTNEDWINTSCPKCGAEGKRETDTMDTFANSSWYFLRYCDSRNDKEIFDGKKVSYWMPVDQYIGGAEHATMHLIYARFYTKFLRDIGLLEFDEPFSSLFNQGMIHGEDGSVMSKSRGNVVDPLETCEEFGADTLRFFLVSMASPDKDMIWNSTAIISVHKFVNKVWDFFQKVKIEKSSAKLESKLNKTIKELGEDIENFKYNLAVIKIRQLFSSFESESEIAKDDLEKFLKIFSVFCPHISEELWNNLGNEEMISLSKWPEVDESKINEKFEQEEKAFEKTVSDINNLLNLMKEKGKEINKIYIYTIPPELEIYNEEKLSKRFGVNVKIFASNDKDKYDPEGKAGKAKPGKPGIYLE